MATANDVIGRALRLAGIVAAGETLEADMAADALSALNALLAEWHEAQIGLPDYSAAELTTELTIDDADREAVAYHLCLRIAPEYGGEVSPLVAVMAEQMLARLRLRYFQPGTVDYSELPARTYAFNIEAGE